MVLTTEVACNVSQERKVPVSRHVWRSVLSVAKVVASRLLVRFIGLADSGHERVVGATIVGVVVGECVEPRRGSWRRGPANINNIVNSCVRNVGNSMYKRVCPECASAEEAENY